MCLLFSFLFWTTFIMLNIIKQLIINVLRHKIGKLVLDFVRYSVLFWENKTDDTKGTHGNFRIIRIG